MKTLLRYDGRWADMPGQPRQWTILSHFIDRDGADRFRGSFGLDGLQALEIVPVHIDSGCKEGGHCDHKPCCYCREAVRVRREAIDLIREVLP